jgi:hypothetical protein
MVRELAEELQMRPQDGENRSPEPVGSGVIRSELPGKGRENITLSRGGRNPGHLRRFYSSDRGRNWEHDFASLADPHQSIQEDKQPSSVQNTDALVRAK